MTDKEKLAKLIHNIKEIVPYVDATISENNSFKVSSLIGAYSPQDTENWRAINRGRANSSQNQLANLLRLAKEMENEST